MLPRKQFDVIVVGAGFGGLFALYRLRNAGLSVQVVDGADGVGGTWYWNRYPGARCDVPSLEYSYSFSSDLEQDWHWTERYAAQPEIEKYLNHVADRFDLRKDIALGQWVTSAVRDAKTNSWMVETSDGQIRTATSLVLAVGGYSTPIVPDIEGLGDFQGEVYYSHHWPKSDIEFNGKRIGIVGTGSSGMQIITEIAKSPVEHLYVFQRTPNYCVPARNGPMDPGYEAEFKQHYAEHREVSRNSSFGVGYPVGHGRTMDLSEAEFDARIARAFDYGGPAVLSAFPDFLMDEAANDRVAEALRAHVRSRVRDSAVADLLSPKTHYVGARRLLVEEGYLESFNLRHVSLVDISSTPIERLTAHALVTKSQTYQLDMLILATGFDSGSGSFLKINPQGNDGVDLRAHWATGPRTYLGMMASRFPNMFMLYAPGSPGIRSQGALMAEIQSDWIANLLDYMKALQLDVVEATLDAEESWTDHVAEVAAASLSTKNETQYVGANVPGKPRVYGAYLGGVGFYRRFCNKIGAEDYAGLLFRQGDGEVVRRGRWSAPDVADIRVSAI